MITPLPSGSIVRSETASPMPRRKNWPLSERAAVGAERGLGGVPSVALLIAATDADLELQISESGFREALVYFLREELQSSGDAHRKAKDLSDQTSAVCFG